MACISCAFTEKAIRFQSKTVHWYMRCNWNTIPNLEYTRPISIYVKSLMRVRVLTLFTASTQTNVKMRRLKHSHNGKYLNVCIYKIIVCVIHTIHWYTAQHPKIKITIYLYTIPIHARGNSGTLQYISVLCVWRNYVYIYILFHL